MSRPKCNKCPNFLKNDEISYFCNNPQVLLINNYICKNHWCVCMPSKQPWNFIFECAVCDNNICKTCKFITKKGLSLCDTCHTKLFY